MSLNKGIAIALLLLPGIVFSQEIYPQLGKNSIKEVISAMTLAEKINLVKGVGMTVSDGTDGPVAGSINGKVKGAAGSTEKISRLGIPAIIVADGPAGLRIEPVKYGKDSLLKYPTAFPSGTAIASTWNTSLVAKAGKAIGQEVLEFGIDVILAPGINIQRDLLCGRNFEYYSEDPVVSGNIAAAFINGIQSNNVGTSIKHFAVNNQETNRNSIDAILSQRALREIYLKGFEIAIKKSNPWTVMSSYNKINGTYASENFDLLSTILRKEWNYGGLVMTDWFAGKNYPGQLKAGNDLLMPGRKNEPGKIRQAIEDGSFSEQDLNKNVERILTLIVKTPAFQNYKNNNNPDLVGHSRVSQELASEGMVLLKNIDHVLPFQTKRISLLGNASYDTFFGGTGSGEVKIADKVSFFDGLKKADFKIDEVLASKYFSFIENEKKERPKRMSILEAIKPVDEMLLDDHQIEILANNSDVALISIGRNAGEGSDRNVVTDYNFSEKELTLIRNTSKIFHKNNKKVVVVLNIDALVDVAKWQDLVDGILITWLPGKQAGDALASIIMGKISPSGKLTQTIPLKYGDTPSSDSFPGIPKERPQKAYYNEGIYVGYRYYTTFKKPVAYEFGYGLSYTTFLINKISVSTLKPSKELKISVNVKNTGGFSGKEVVQLYVSAPGKSIEKPEIELKAFAKTETLKSGKSQKIEFKLPFAELASFDTKRSAWVIEPGLYTIKIGNSSKNIQQTASLEIDSEVIAEKVNNILAPQEPFDELKK